jgi:antitoxin component YwqK of YwqJK toxin-antitoxin module
MKTYSRLTLAFLLLILVVPQVIAEEPPENGPYVEYYENGKKKLESHYKDGLQDGLETFWLEDGQKKEESHWKNHKLDGLGTKWNEDGKKVLEIQYKDGKEVSRKEF